MATFYICRHGETENNRARRLSGWIDSPLTKNGLIPTQEVISIIKNIKIDEIYSSDLGRAFITAYVIARGIGFEKEIIRLPGLREVNYGDVGNMKSEEAFRLYPGVDREIHFIPPNGESLDQMQVRILATINELNNKHKDKTVLLVSHSGVMAAINSSYSGQDFGEHNISEAYPHEYVARFTIKDGKVASFDKVIG